MSTYSIRHARPYEIADIQRLNGALFLHEEDKDQTLDAIWPYSKEGEAYFKERIDDAFTDSICLVVDVEGKIVGYLAAAIMETDNTRPLTRVELENVYIMPEYRHLGVGRALFDAFKHWAKLKHAKMLVVEVYTQSKDAIRFYEKCGFYELSKTMEQPL